jgi:histidinol-phosphate aminotransferase
MKLDFNERADSKPRWLDNFSADTSLLWKYPDRNEVQQLIANKYNTTAENVFLSNGGDESIELLFKLCKLKQHSILLPLPAFSQYTHNLKIWGINNRIIAGLDNMAIDTESIKGRLKDSQWLIITRPNNPTGECINDEVLIDLIKAAKDKGAYVFLDQAYIEFYPENSDINYALQFDNVICLGTFSKAYGLAGARLGYLIGNKALIEQFKNIAMPFNVNQLSLQLAKLALKNQDEVKTYCQTVANNRKRIYDFLCSCGIEVFDGKGNFLLFKLAEIKKQLLTLYLSKHNIQIKATVNDLPDCVRLTIPENIGVLMPLLTTALKPQILGFDMDGVLIDTSASYDACIIKTVAFFSNKTVTLADIIKLREQGGFNNDWDLTLGLINQLEQKGRAPELNKVIEKFQQYYNGDDKTAGLKQQETNLLQRPLFDNDYTTAIITGRPRAEALSGVEQLNIKPDYIISADDVRQQKPSPEGINNIKQNSRKQHMWFCGDTVDDMQAGVAANCVCIGIGNNKQRLYQAGADLVLNNINQLEELL